MFISHKINLPKLCKLLGVLIIFTAPIDYYLLNIPFIFNLSLYRLLLIVLIFVFGIYKLINPRLHGKPELYYLVLLYIIGMAIGVIQSRRFGEFSSYFLNEIMGILMIVIFSNIYRRDDLPSLLYTFILSFVFPVIISLYVYYVFYTELRLINILPLSDIVPFFKTIELDTRPFRFGLFPRLGLPYYTSPHLAIVSSILLFISAFFIRNRIVKVLTIIPIIIILIGTLTRTVILSVVITCAFYFIFHLNENKIRLTRIKKTYIFYLLFFIVLIAFIIHSNVFEVFVRRASQRSSITEERHYILLIEAFYIILTSFKNFLFGIGDGNLKFMNGVYTFLPPDSILNSYLTVFVHRGIFGLILNYLLYFYLIFYLFKKRNPSNTISYALLFSYINVLVAFNFYELRLVNGVWILIALIAVYINNYKSNEEANNFGGSNL